MFIFALMSNFEIDISLIPTSALLEARSQLKSRIEEREKELSITQEKIK